MVWIVTFSKSGVGANKVMCTFTKTHMFHKEDITVEVETKVTTEVLAGMWRKELRGVREQKQINIEKIAKKKIPHTGDTESLVRCV